MTQTTSSHLQFERLEESLENWRDQLTQLAPYLPQSDLAKMTRRWDVMRQNLDAIFMNYGHPTSSPIVAMESLPALMDLDQEELDIIAEAMANARKTIGAFVLESEQRIPLLEQALNADQKPERLRRVLAKMRAIDESFQLRLQNIVAYSERFHSALESSETLAHITQQVIERTKRIEALKKANIVLEDQRKHMAHWLQESQRRLEKTPALNVPSPHELEKVGQTIAPRSEADIALDKLYSSREKIREATRYLANVLKVKESEL